MTTEPANGIQRWASSESLDDGTRPLPTARPSHLSEHARSAHRQSPVTHAWLWSAEQWRAPAELSPNCQRTWHTAAEEHHPDLSAAVSSTPPAQPASLDTLWPSGLAAFDDDEPCSHHLGAKTNNDHVPGTSANTYDDRHASVGEVRYSLLQSGKRRAHTSVHTRLQQVDVWTAQLIAEEERAKQNSAYLLFVIDPTTVNAATFVEIPYLIAQGKKLVIVFLNQDAWLCNGHKCDRKDRDRLMCFIHTIMAYHSTPMFTSVVDGLDYLIKALITDMSLVKALQLRCELSRIIYRTCSRNKNARQLLARIHTDRLRDSLQLCWSCVTFDNTRAAVGARPRTLRRLVMSGEALLAIAVCIASPSLPLSVLVLALLYTHVASSERSSDDSDTGLMRSASEQQLAPMNSQSRRRTFDVQSKAGRALLDVCRRKSLQRSDRRRANRRSGTHQQHTAAAATGGAADYDVFVAGSGSTVDLQWVARVARPLLAAHNIAYVDVTMCTTFVHRARIMPNCAYVVYHTSSPLSVLSGLSELAYLMGAYGSRVVASVPPWCINVAVCECLCAATEITIRIRNRCYARAFEYLRDIAARNNCPLFKRAEDAVHHAITASASGARVSSADLHTPQSAAGDGRPRTPPRSTVVLMHSVST